MNTRLKDLKIVELSVSLLSPKFPNTIMRLLGACGLDMKDGINLNCQTPTSNWHENLSAIAKEYLEQIYIVVELTDDSKDGFEYGGHSGPNSWWIWAGVDKNKLTISIKKNPTGNSSGLDLLDLVSQILDQVDDYVPGSVKFRFTSINELIEGEYSVGESIIEVGGECTISSLPDTNDEVAFDYDIKITGPQKVIQDIKKEMQMSHMLPPEARLIKSC